MKHGRDGWRLCNVVSKKFVVPKITLDREDEQQNVTGDECREDKYRLPFQARRQLLRCPARH